MKIWCETCKGSKHITTVLPLGEGIRGIGATFMEQCKCCKGKGYTEPEELDELIELGKAFKYLFESPSMEEYVVLSIGKHTYDTLEEVVEEYKSWLKCED